MPTHQLILQAGELLQGDDQWLPHQDQQLGFDDSIHAIFGVNGGDVLLTVGSELSLGRDLSQMLRNIQEPLIVAAEQHLALRVQDQQIRLLRGTVMGQQGECLFLDLEPGEAGDQPAVEPLFTP